MHQIDIKPLSVNQAWQGKRYKTDKYKAYEWAVSMKLPKEIDIPEGELELHLHFGFSSTLADFDNPVKPFVDILQKKYGFNDKRIRRCVIEVDDNRTKGTEYVSFDIKERRAS